MFRKTLKRGEGSAKFRQLDAADVADVAVIGLK